MLVWTNTSVKYSTIVPLCDTSGSLSNVYAGHNACTLLIVHTPCKQYLDVFLKQAKRGNGNVAATFWVAGSHRNI